MRRYPSFAVLVCVAASLGSCGDGVPATWAPAYDATATGWLLNVWGPSANDLYAVGGSPAAGVVMHFDGAAWTPLDTGVTPAPALLNWSYGFGPDDVFIVGAGGTVLHGGGHAWSRQPTPSTSMLWGVWGAAPNDVYAVGGPGDASGHATVLHYDGSAWTEVALPAFTRPNVYAFYKVWGADAGHVFVVGQNGIVMRYDGTWHEDDLDLVADAISVWGTSADHVLVIGGRSNGYVARWDGATWTTRSLSPIPGMNGIWMRDPRFAHAVGAEGTILRIDAATLAVDRDDTQDTMRLDLHSVFGDPGGVLTSVGGNLSATRAPYKGVALHRRLASGE